MTTNSLRAFGAPAERAYFERLSARLPAFALNVLRRFYGVAGPLSEMSYGNAGALIALQGVVTCHADGDLERAMEVGTSLDDAKRRLVQSLVSPPEGAKILRASLIEEDGMQLRPQWRRARDIQTGTERARKLFKTDGKPIISAIEEELASPTLQRPRTSQTRAIDDRARALFGRSLRYSL